VRIPSGAKTPDSLELRRGNPGASRQNNTTVLAAEF
jgi:hypothetical protein